jgi:site-specific recombinase XerD
MEPSNIQPLFENIDSQDFTFLTQQLFQAPGYNRSDKPNLLEATNDAQAIQTFLSDYRQTKLTYRSYLKEIERLALWCIHVPQLTISDLKREHFTLYREFLADPQPYNLWCGPRAQRFLDTDQPNPAWRPFASPLSKPTIRKTISILDSFFNYLVKNNYLAGNPLAVDRRRKGIKSRSTERWLERDEISIVLDALSLQPQETPEQTFQILRARYIILTLFYTGLRLAELTSHTMGNFCLIEDEWYIKVIGKGEKPRNIVVVDEFQDVLISFRNAIGLRTNLPEYQESTPLVPSQNLKESLTPSRVWQILKWSFELGAQHYERLPTNSEEERLKFDHKASKLRKASTHWLRHSYGTYLVKSGCPIEKVKELMGHSDIGTTMIYVHIAKNDLHESARGLSLMDNE